MQQTVAVEKYTLCNKKVIKQSDTQTFQLQLNTEELSALLLIVRGEQYAELDGDDEDYCKLLDGLYDKLNNIIETEVMSNKPIN